MSIPATRPYFTGLRVELTDTKLRAVPEHFDWIPGMALTAEMKVGQRSVISLFPLSSVTRARREHPRTIAPRTSSSSSGRLNKSAPEKCRTG